MIDNIKLLKNVGTFDSNSAAASFSLKRLTLIYAENGRGKTTLAAVLRSLATGDPNPITERWRFGSDHHPHVVLDCHDQPSCLVFQNGEWNETLPELKIFDDDFVDENVHSGLHVDAQHRQKLHEFILGDRGVALNRELEEFVSRVEQHNAELGRKERAIPQHALGRLIVDDFCSLPELPEIDNKIKSAERILIAARDKENVRAGSLFAPIELPELDIEAIKQTLLTGLPDLDRAAEARVKTHVQALGEGGESWVADGSRLVEDGDNKSCPFCSQEIDGLDLIAHYRAYFSERYDHLKREVTDMVAYIESRHGGSSQAAFERAVSKARETGQFWKTFLDVTNVNIDTEAIALDWEAARETAVKMLQAKQAAPMERIELDHQALKTLESYDTHRHEIRDINKNLTASNEAICDFRIRTEATKKDEIQVEFDRLKATKARFSEEIAPLCVDYLQEKDSKERAVSARNEARKALDVYRENVFPKIQVGVNKFLREFRAGFRVEGLEHANIGGGTGSTCTYKLVINDTPIAVRSSKVPQGKPSFRNSLSAGDRNTLALALFFSSLYQNPELENSVVVIDDPVSSLDDHRSYATVQAVRDLSKRAGQVIVLSHNRRFLCHIWDHPNRKEWCSLEIAQNGDKSIICTWDVSLDALTEHDKRHQLLREYADTMSGDKRKVAEAIRPHLERFLRVACPDKFPPKQELGSFTKDCEDRIGKPDEVLDNEEIRRLKDIVEYGNRFHHDKDLAWQTEEINGQELLGYVEKALSFVRPGE